MKSRAGGGLVAVVVIAMGCGDPDPVPPDAGPAVLVFSASTVMFPDTIVDQFATAAIKTLTVTNTGGDSLKPTFSVTNEADFVIQGTTCHALAAGASCEVTIRFDPDTLGARQAELVASVPDSTTSATLVGVAVPQPGLRTQPATSVVFEDVAVGSYGMQRVTVVNASGVAARPYAVAIIGPDAASFSITQNACAGTSAWQCDIDVRFSPASAMLHGAQLVVSSGNLGDVVLPLTASAFRPAKLEISPSIGTFGPLFQFTLSAQQRFTVTNTGTVPTEVLSMVRAIDDVADFGIYDLCSTAVLAPGSSCTLLVNYQPIEARTHTTTVSVGPPWDSPPVLTLTGTAMPAQLAITPGTWDFGGIVIGQTTPPKRFVVQNIGATPTGALRVEMLYSNSWFDLVADSCSGTNLAPGATCSVSVQATAWSHMPTSATLVISAARGDRMIGNLSFEGYIAGTLAAAPSFVDFGSVPPTGAPTKRVIIFNAGDLDLGPVTVTVTGPDAASLSLVDTCSGIPLSTSGSCDLDLTFSPVHGGAHTASLQLTAPGSTLTIPVTATALP